VDDIEREQDQPAAENSVDIIAAALVEKFGATDALTIAERQLETASGDTRETWFGVVAELSR
jgi:hypothetical protein